MRLIVSPQASLCQRRHQRGAHLQADPKGGVGRFILGVSPHPTHPYPTPPFTHTRPTTTTATSLPLPDRPPAPPHTPPPRASTYAWAPGSLGVGRRCPHRTPRPVRGLPPLRTALRGDCHQSHTPRPPFPPRLLLLPTHPCRCVGGWVGWRVRACVRARVRACGKRWEKVGKCYSPPTPHPVPSWPARAWAPARTAGPPARQ
jgi:hypothetical protein